jgi:hypothetical protein
MHRRDLGRTRGIDVHVVCRRDMVLGHARDERHGLHAALCGGYVFIGSWGRKCVQLHPVLTWELVRARCGKLHTMRGRDLVGGNRGATGFNLRGVRPRILFERDWGREQVYLPALRPGILVTERRDRLLPVWRGNMVAGWRT